MIYLARHGETTWNHAGRYQGRLESPLSPLGGLQALALAEYFAARASSVPGRVISSPLSRCVDTARPAAERLGLEVESDERLVEIAHGTWEGRYRNELAANDPERYRAWRHDPANVAFENGETLDDVMARWRAFLRDIASETRDVLVVTHDAVIRCALLDVANRPLDDFWKMRVENGAFARLESNGTVLELLEECHSTHLRNFRAAITEQAL